MKSCCKDAFETDPEVKNKGKRAGSARKFNLLQLFSFLKLKGMKKAKA